MIKYHQGERKVIGHKAGMGYGEIAMKEVLMEMVKDKVDEKVSAAEVAKEQQTTVIHIRDIMDSFDVTVERAMESLKIPQSQRSIYADLVGKQMQ